jgi:hypothetical protein
MWRVGLPDGTVLTDKRGHPRKFKSAAMAMARADQILK